MTTLVFKDLVLFSISHTTSPIFVGPHANVLLQIVHFYWQPIEQCHQRTGISTFVCGEDLVCHSRILEEWTQDRTLENPCNGADFVR